MEQSSVHTRRGLARLGVSALAVSSLPGLALAANPQGRDLLATPAADPWHGLKMGVATYTFVKLPLDATLQALKRVDVHYASVKDAHLSLKSTSEERKAVAQKFKDAGVTLLSCGNISPGLKEESIRNMFEYARDAGIPTIVCTPEKETLSTIDRYIKEFGIKIAIHNHGPEDKKWPSPNEVWEAVQPFDERMGLCIDVGHTARTGVDPVEAIRKCAPRLHDLHIKDIAVASGSSKPVELGRGVLDLKGILQALLEMKYAGLVGLEFEKNQNDPIPGTAESIGYLKGVLAGMKQS